MVGRLFAEFRYFVRWDAILRLREDRKVASRAVFQMLQTGATERMKASMEAGGEGENWQGHWIAREDAVTSPAALLSRSAAAAAAATSQ